MSSQNQSNEREQVRFWTHGTPEHLEAVCKTMRGLRRLGVRATSVLYQDTWRVLTKPRAEVKKLQELAKQNDELFPPRYEAVAKIESIGLPNGSTESVIRSTDEHWGYIVSLWKLVRETLIEKGLFINEKYPISRSEMAAQEPQQGVEQNEQTPLLASVRLQRRPAGRRPDEDNENAYALWKNDGFSDEAFQHAYDSWLAGRNLNPCRANSKTFKTAMKRAKKRDSGTQ